MPHTCYGPSLVPTPDGTGIIALGCSNSPYAPWSNNVGTDEIFYMTWIENDLKWTLLNKRLKYPRFSAVAYFIPDKLTNCYSNSLNFTNLY